MTDLFLFKLCPLLIILCTTCLTIVLVWLRNRKDIGQFNKIVTDNHDTIAPIIQVLSSVLRIAQTTTICTQFNFANRLRLLGYAYKARGFKLLVCSLNPVTRFRIASSPIGIPGSAPISIAYSWCYLGWLINSEIHDFGERSWIDSNPSISIDFTPFWAGEYLQGDNGAHASGIMCRANKNYEGIVSSCPALSLLGGLVQSASTATSPNQTPRQHQKLDSMGWAYLGRSYGVGSSPGLVELPISSPLNYTAFNYTENGYTSSVTCSKNASSAFTLSNPTISDTGDDRPTVRFWEASGF